MADSANEVKSLRVVSITKKARVEGGFHCKVTVAVDLQTEDEIAQVVSMLNGFVFQGHLGTEIVGAISATLAAKIEEIGALKKVVKSLKFQLVRASTELEQIYSSVGLAK